MFSARVSGAGTPGDAIVVVGAARMKSGGGGKGRLSSVDRSLGAKSWETCLAAFSYARGSPGTVSASTFSTIAAEPLPPELAPALAKLESYFTDPIEFGDVSRGKPMPHKLPAGEEEGSRTDARDVETRSDLRSREPRHARQAVHEERRHRDRLRGAPEARREARRSVREGDDVPQHRLPARHGHLGRRAAPRRPLADASRRRTCAASSTTATTTTTRSRCSAVRCRSAACSKTTTSCRRSSSATSSTASGSTPERGGPVRIVVPEHYGYKSVKWLTHIVLSNLLLRQRHLRHAEQRRR